MNCIDWMSKHSKQSKTTKPIKLQWIASIGCQNDRNKAKLQKWSKSNDLHRFHVKTIKNVELRRKTFKTTLNYNNDQYPMTWIDLMSKHSKYRKTTKLIKLQSIALIGCKNDRNKAKLQMWSKSNDFHRFEVKTIKNVELRRKTFKTTQIYEPIKLQWIASFGCQNDRIKAKLQKWSKSNDLHRFDVKTKLQKWSKSNDLHRFHVKTIKNVELRRKTFKTTLNYKSDQNPMTWIDLMSKHSKQSKTTKQNKLQLIASIGCQNDRNKAKLQKWSKSNDFYRFDVKTIKNFELRRKTFKTTLNYNNDQYPMTWIDLMSKHSKHRKTTKLIKLQSIALIGCKNDRNKAKLQMWSKSNDFHRFEVKTIKNVELRRKTFKTTQIYEPIKLQWIASFGCQNDRIKAKLQKWSKSNDLHRFDVKTKLQKWSKSNDLHRFHVKTIKNVELRRKTFKTTLNYKSDQNPMTWIDLMSKRSNMLSYVAKHSEQR